MSDQIPKSRKKFPLPWADGALLPRKYYNPNDMEIEAVIRHNHRVMFFLAVDARCPEATQDLVRSVLPKYLEFLSWHYERYGLEKDGLGRTIRPTIPPEADPDKELHSRLANDWIAGGSNDWAEDGKPRLDVLQQELTGWTQRYKIHAEWVLQWVLDKLSRIIHGIASSEFNYYTHVMDPLKFPPFDPAETRAFTYPQWTGEDERGYRYMLKRMFRGHVDRYMAENRKLAKTMERVPTTRRGIRYEMLALYLCADMPIATEAREDTRRSIMEEFDLVDREESTVRRRIKRVAAEVGIPMRPAGRPRKTGKSAAPDQ